MTDFTPYEGKTVKNIEPVSNYGGVLWGIRVNFTDDTSIEVHATTVMFDQYSSSPCLKMLDSPA